MDLARIEAFLRRDPALHAYELGDLDPVFLPHTRWFTYPEDGPPQAVALLYTGTLPETLLCFGGDAAAALLRSLSPSLPTTVYAHLTPGLAGALGRVAEPRGRHSKMVLADLSSHASAVGTELLGPEHQDELLTFYQECYPDNWFNARMLSVEPYVGIREAGVLVAVAGLHVWSPRHRVAALGNVAVRPSHRGRGLAFQVTGALCRRLLTRADTIALNVERDNVAAVRCYRRLGFVDVAEYDELLFHAPPYPPNAP